MDAIALLKKHHKKTKASLKKLAREPDAELLSEIADEMAGHMIIEETIFYPAASRVKPDLVLESYEEHAIAQFELKRLLATDLEDDRFEARVKALLELFTSHADEEEQDLFPRIEKAFDEDELDIMGAQMKETFDEIVDRGHEAVLPRPPATVTADRLSKRIASEALHVG